MSTPSELDKANAMIDRKGIFGFGFSANSNLDLMNLVVLAVAGIIIKIFFEENHTKLGNSGPAATTIWGYGLTGVALFLMLFMAIYISSNRKIFEESAKNQSIFMYYLKTLSEGALPVLLTLGLIIYIIVLNYMYFTRINSNKVSDTYPIYSFFSSLLVVIQIGLIVKYMYSILGRINTKDNNPEYKKQEAILKGLSLITITVNYIFVLILHILLAFFSTDG